MSASRRLPLVGAALASLLCLLFVSRGRRKENRGNGECRRGSLNSNRDSVTTRDIGYVSVRLNVRESKE